MSYTVQLISPQEKDRLFEAYDARLHYTSKADIYGCCIKLLTESEKMRNEWEDNFFSANENIRSHGRLVVVKEPGEPLTVMYDAYTKTAFLINVNYYGWIKSIVALARRSILQRGLAEDLAGPMGPPDAAPRRGMGARWANGEQGPAAALQAHFLHASGDRFCRSALLFSRESWRAGGGVGELNEIGRIASNTTSRSR